LITISVDGEYIKVKKQGGEICNQLFFIFNGFSGSDLFHGNWKGKEIMAFDIHFQKDIWL